MSARALVEARGLRAGYGAGVDAISGVELTVDEGQLVAVLGPNGGGKTTFFRALLDELPHRAGEVALHGRVAYVPQTERARLDFPVSALDVALMGTYAATPWYRRLGAASRASARDALARVDMAAHAREPFGELSGGQRQRVLIARALARDARILLLDEPLSGLDRPAADRVQAVLEGLRSDGRALLVATHDIQHAREFDRVLCLNGTQIAYGSTADALTSDTLERTYGGELITLPDGARAVVVQHHAH